jgi:hypothetical protein
MHTVMHMRKGPTRRHRFGIVSGKKHFSEDLSQFPGQSRYVPGVFFLFVVPVNLVLKSAALRSHAFRILGYADVKH